jgi:hypothetical protein
LARQVLPKPEVVLRLPNHDRSILLKYWPNGLIA